MNATVTLPELMTDLKRRHDNISRAGDPVVPWAEFVTAAADMIEAEAEYDRAMENANAVLDCLVPPAERYCNWAAYAEAGAVAVYDLFTDAPNGIHPDDFRFKLSYGKSRRSPLAHMARVAERYRVHVRKVRRTLARKDVVSLLDALTGAPK